MYTGSSCNQSTQFTSNEHQPIRTRLDGFTDLKDALKNIKGRGGFS